MKPVRRKSPPGTYFVTSGIAGRRGLFRYERYACLFVEVLYAYRAEGHYRLHEFVAMPEHIHLILSPAMNVTLEQAMQFIKGGFSYRVKRETEWKLEVWQRGFTDHRIRDVEDFMKHRQYVRQNPVKRGLVMAAEEYRWSSAYPGYELDHYEEGLTSAAKAAE